MSDDFFTGGPVGNGQGGVPAPDGGAPEGSYQESGEYTAAGSYGGGDYTPGDVFGEHDQQQPSGDGTTNGFDTGVGSFTQAYASLDEPANGAVGNGVVDNGITDRTDMGMPAPEDVEPSALDEFMKRWQSSLVEKASIEAEAKGAVLEAARADLEAHGLERATHKETKMGRNREQEQIFLEDLEGELESENPWERVLSLVDTQAEVVADFEDKSRMRSILIQLKNGPIETPAS